MTTIGMHYDVVSGKESEFEQGFKNVLTHLASVPGHRESRLYHDVGEPGSYMILSQWDSKETFDAFIRSEAFNAVKNWGRTEILRGRPKHKVYLNQ